MKQIFTTTMVYCGLFLTLFLEIGLALLSLATPIVIGYFIWSWFTADDSPSKSEALCEDFVKEYGERNRWFCAAIEDEACRLALENQVGKLPHDENGNPYYTSETFPHECLKYMN